MAKKIIPFMPHGDASLFDDIVIEELINQIPDETKESKRAAAGKQLQEMYEKKLADQRKIIPFKKSYLNRFKDHIKKPDTIWKKASGTASKFLKTPLGKLGSRFLGGAPAALALEMDFSKPFPFMPGDYKYTPIGSSTIWE
mgnify:CR=1 FL=1